MGTSSSRPRRSRVKPPDPAPETAQTGCWTSITAMPDDQGMRMLARLVERRSNVVLYGPPGVGKTDLAQHLAVYILLSRNLSPARAEDYWRSIRAGDEERARGLKNEVQFTEEGEKRVNYWWMREFLEKWTWEQLARDSELTVNLNPAELHLEEVRPGDI